MGRHRFRLSEMMPNAWFYKLKASMTRSGKKPISIPLQVRSTVPTQLPQQPAPPPINPGRASYYIPSGEHGKLLPWSPARLPRGATDTSRLLLDVPRKSGKKSRRVPGARARAPPPANPCTVRFVSDAELKSESESSTESPLIPCGRAGSEDDEAHGGLPCTDKVVISEHFKGRGWETDSTKSDVASNSELLDSEVSLQVVEVDLPPILTKPIKRELSLASPRREYRRFAGKQRPQGPKPRVLVTTPRITAKPRVLSQEQHSRLRRKTCGEATVAINGKARVMAGSVAVVRASADPKRDFQESMMEMIAANGIRGTHELEELLACYLSLNSREYHDVIVKVFEQVWFNLARGYRIKKR